MYILITISPIKNYTPIPHKNYFIFRINTYRNKISNIKEMRCTIMKKTILILPLSIAIITIGLISTTSQKEALDNIKDEKNVQITAVVANNLNGASVTYKTEPIKFSLSTDSKITSDTTKTITETEIITTTVQTTSTPPKLETTTNVTTTEKPEVVLTEEPAVIIPVQQPDPEPILPPATDPPPPPPPPQTEPPAPPPVVVDPQIELSNDFNIDEVIRLVNIERANAGLPSLQMSSVANSAAAVRANEIIVKFDHVRPNGQSCFSVLAEWGISSGYSGENIALGQRNPSEVVTAWMNSAGHKKNILNPNYTHIGIGYNLNDNVSIGWVQLFISQ